MILYLGIFFLSLAYYLYRILTPTRPHNFPPGPKSYPLVGGAWIFSQLQKDEIDVGESNNPFITSMLLLGKKYGPVAGIGLGPKLRSIIVTGYPQIKHVLTSPAFQGRPALFLNKYINGPLNKKLGLLFSEGMAWQEQRRFTLRHMRDFGFGKSEIETVIHTEIKDLLERLENRTKHEKVIELQEEFGPPVINVLWSIIAGRRFDHDDPEFRNLLQILNKFFRSGTPGWNPVQDFPFLRFIPPFKKKFDALVQCRMAVLDMIRKEVVEHRKTKVGDFDRDFIDVYLKEIDKEGGNDFTEDQLMAICSDLFSAGAETTSNFIAFCILYMILYPEIQDKVRQELENVVGNERLPSYEDRTRLPFTTAVISELTRLTNVAPHTVPHSTMEDTLIDGYNVPKHTFVMVVLAAVHQDKEFWGEDALSFKPERFLDENNELIKEKVDRLIGFGLGKRVCLGEHLARMNTFLFFTAFLQKFNVSLVSNEEPPSMEPMEGFTLAPKPFKGKLTPNF